MEKKEASTKTNFTAPKRLPKRIKEIDSYLQSESGQSYIRLMDAVIKRYIVPIEKHTQDRKKNNELWSEFSEIISKVPNKRNDRRCVFFLRKNDSPEFRYTIFNKYDVIESRIYKNWQENNFDLKQVYQKSSKSEKMLLDMFLVWFKEASTLDANEKNITVYLRSKYRYNKMKSIIIGAASIFLGITAYSVLKQILDPPNLDKYKEYLT